jgi:type-F conjugative transfer system pilin assembly protein TrbC
LSENTHSEGDNLDEDPLLDEDLTPLPGSPCINTGDNDAPELGCGDYNGHKRIHDGTVDRGAIEFGSTDSADPNCGDTDPDPNNPTDPNNPIPTPPSIGSGGGGCFLGTALTVDPDSDVYKSVKRIAERHNSPEFRAAMEKVRQEVKPIIKKQCRQLNRDVAKNARDRVDPDRPELLVFVSASMPPDTTAVLARDAHQIREKSEVRFVLRGFPKGGLTDYLQGIHASDYNLNLTVDPFLYDTYEVEQVPAVVVNRAVKIDHPRNLKTALTRIQAASDQNLKPLIKDLNW